MNCKQGDIAVVIRAINTKNIGRVCQCLKHKREARMMPSGDSGIFDCWETDQAFEDWTGRADHSMEDMNLKPLRDTDGVDEMLRITGKPKEKKNVVAKRVPVMIDDGK